MNIRDRYEVNGFDPTGVDAISCDQCGRDNGEVAVSLVDSQFGTNWLCDSHIEGLAASEGTQE
jgi:hypothetical protein